MVLRVAGGGRRRAGRSLRARDAPRLALVVELDAKRPGQGPGEGYLSSLRSRSGCRKSLGLKVQVALPELIAESIGLLEVTPDACREPLRDYTIDEADLDRPGVCRVAPVIVRRSRRHRPHA